MKMSVRVSGMGASALTPKLTNGLLLVLMSAAHVAGDTMIPAMRLPVESPASAPSFPRSDFDHATMQELLDGMIARLRQGEALSDQDRVRCRAEFSQYFERLQAVQPSRSNHQFTEPDRTDYYLNAVRMALIDEKEHGGWPFRSALRVPVIAEINRRLAVSYDPFLEFSILFTIMQSNSDDFAVRVYRRIREADPFLADTAIAWSFRQFGNVDWLVEDLLQDGDRETIETIASRSVSVDTAASLESAGSLHERLGNHEQAEALYQRAESVYGYPGALAHYYCRRARLAAPEGDVYRERLQRLWERHYPNGVQHVTVDDFSAAPQTGLILRSTSRVTAAHALGVGTIIVAIDGVRVENLLQYYVVRDVNRENPAMDLIVWRDGQYERMTVNAPNRRLRAMVEAYTAM